MKTLIPLFEAVEVSYQLPPATRLCVQLGLFVASFVSMIMEKLLA